MFVFFVVFFCWFLCGAAEEGDREGPVGMLYMTHDFIDQVIKGVTFLCVTKKCKA